MSTLVRTTSADVCGDLADANRVWLDFLHVVNSVGLMVLATSRHDFPGGGMTGLVLLGESHAAIHTWPERGAAWVELATCGGGLEEFEQAVSKTWCVEGAFTRTGK